MNYIGFVPLMSCSQDQVSPRPPSIVVSQSPVRDSLDCVFCLLASTSSLHIDSAAGQLRNYLIMASNATVLTDQASSSASAQPQAPSTITTIVPKLQNIVATFDLKCHIDLKHIARSCRNAEYNAKRFAAAILRIRSPKTTALVFASGKVVVTGAKSESDSRLSCRKYARILQKVGFQVQFKDWKIQNIVGSADSKMLTRFEGIAEEHRWFARYDPELFPGLVYRVADEMGTRVVLLVFAKGKVVITGAKTREHVFEAWDKVFPLLVEHKFPEKKGQTAL